MPAVHETAYPRLKEAVTPTDLAEVYTPTGKEIALAIDTSPRPEARLGFLILLWLPAGVAVTPVGAALEHRMADIAA